MGELKFSLQGVPVSFEEFDEVAKYNIKMKDVPIPKETLEAAKKILDQAPKPENEREKAIYDSGYKVGFVMAMADKELWWRIELAKHRQQTAPSRKANTERHHRMLARQYLILRRAESDIEARNTLNKRHGHDLSYITKILKRQGVL